MQKSCKLIKGGLYISNHGWFAPCFNSFHNIGDTSGLNIKNISIRDYYNSDWNNSYNHNVNVLGHDSRCSNCYHEEDLGKQSFRLKVKNRNLDDRPARLLQLNLGNLCNNACLTCNPYQSSKLAQEWSQINLYKHQEFSNYLKGFDPAQAISSEWWVNDSHRLDSVLDDLLELAPDSLGLIGGEPTINPLTKTILTKLLPIAKNTEIHFTTNGRVFDQELVELLDNYKNVVIRISVDGYKQINEFVRYPSQWHEFEEVVEQWIGTNAHIKFNIGLSALTALNMDQLLVYLDQKFQADIEMWHLFDPVFLHCGQLPQSTIDKAIERLENISVNQNTTLVKDYALNHLKNIKLSDDGKFEQFIKLMCQTRKQNFKHYWSLIVGE